MWLTLFPSIVLFLFQTVVNLYLLEGIPLISKHTVVLYLLFDLMHLEEDSSELVSVLSQMLKYNVVAGKIVK